MKLPVVRPELESDGSAFDPVFQEISGPIPADATVGRENLSNWALVVPGFALSRLVTTAFVTFFETSA